MNYAKLIKQDWPLLSFGFLLTALTGPGQTYFVGLFRDSITAHFNISIGEFGLIFSTATLTSAVVFFWTGKLIDRWSLRSCVTIFSGLFAMAAALIGLAPHIIIFALAIFGVRHLGQAIMSHTSATTMARYFNHNRAKAISLASMGYAVGEAIFPITIVAIMGLIGWRETWGVVAGMILLVFLPLAHFLLNKSHRNLSLDAKLSENKTATKDIYTSEEERHWTRKEVIGDKRFWLVFPALLASPFLTTGLFFHLSSLATEADISLGFLASLFTLFAITKIVGSLIMGPLVDRYGFLKLYPLSAATLTAAFFVLAGSYNIENLVGFYALAGFAIGSSIPISGSLWPGFYGIKHLGAIRSMTASIMVLATGLAPATFGYLLEAGVTLTSIMTLGAFYSLFATLCLIYLMVRAR